MLTGAELHRAVGEHVHPVDQVADAVGLVLDELAEFAVAVVDARLFQQLRGAADARQRVLDLMRQHLRHRRGATGGAEEIELAVHHLRGGAIVQRQHHPARHLRQRPAMRGDAAAVQPRAVQQHVVVGDRRLMLADLGQQGEQPAVLGQQVAEAGMVASVGKESWKNSSAAGLA